MDGQHQTKATPHQEVHRLYTPEATTRGPRYRPGRYRRDDKDSDMDRGPPNAVLTGPAAIAQGSVTEEDTEMHDVQDPWELVENDTPPYIRDQQAKARLGAGIAAADKNITTDNLHEEPFTFVGRKPPTDTIDNGGNRVRVYQHSTARHVSFAQGTASPRPRASGTPMYSYGRRPSPFPLRPVGTDAILMRDVERAPTPFPPFFQAPKPLDLSKMPSQQEIEFRQRLDQNYREGLEMRGKQAEDRTAAGPFGASSRYQRAAIQGSGTASRQPEVLQQPGMSESNPPIGGTLGRPNGGIRYQTGPLPRHPDGRFKHPPLGWRPTEIDERQVFIDEYGVVPWEDQTPYNLAAIDRRRGINNPLRPTKPTWEEEDDSDEGQLLDHHRAVRGACAPRREIEDDSDDEASMKQNRPEDYQGRPPGRRVLRVMNPDIDDPLAMSPPEQKPKPSVCRAANVNQAPLYGKLALNNGARHQKYDPTHRFDEWLRDATDATKARDDYFHEWLRAKEAEVAMKQGLTGKPNCASPGAGKLTPAESNTVTAANSSALARKDGAKDGKRGADSPVDERPSKRSRLASTFRRKLSLSGTGLGTTHGSGDTSNISSKRRLSGLDMFNVRSFSSMNTGLSRASSSAGPKRIRIAVVGDSFAGKTTLLNRLYTGMYQPAEKSAYYRNNDFSMVFGGHPIILEAWDIPGALPADESHPLNRSFFDAALICFAVDNAQNVDNAPHWVDVLQSCLVVDIPLYLVGTKSDARPCFPKLRLPFMNEATPSSREQCENAARHIGAVEYFECSAKTGDGVNDMFDTVIKHVRSRKDEEELKRLSRLRKEKLKRGLRDTGRRISNLFRGKGDNV